MTNAAVDAAGSEVEKFAAAPGRWLGWAMVLLAAALVVFEGGVADPVQDRKAIYVASVVAAVSWVVLIRPEVSATANGVLMRNMLRDVFVPWSKIRRCRVLQTVQLVTDDSRFHGLGVSRSARKMAKQNFGRASIMGGGLSQLMSMGGTAAAEAPSKRASHASAQPIRDGVAYEDYVETRISEHAQAAKSDDLEPVVAWAWPAVGAVAVVAVLAVLIAL